MKRSEPQTQKCYEGKGRKMSPMSQWESIQKNQSYWHPDHVLLAFKAGEEHMACLSWESLLRHSSLRMAAVYGVVLEKSLAQSSLERCPQVGNHVSLVLWLISVLALGWRFNTQQNWWRWTQELQSWPNTTAHTSNGKGCHAPCSPSVDLWTVLGDEEEEEAEQMHNAWPHTSRHGEGRKQTQS